jgi:hypothetical protein
VYFRKGIYMKKRIAGLIIGVIIVGIIDAVLYSSFKMNLGTVICIDAAMVVFSVLIVFLCAFYVVCTVARINNSVWGSMPSGFGGKQK